MSPPPQEGRSFFLNFLTTFQSSLYGPVYLALSAVTLPLHRRIRPFTTNGAISPRDGLFTPVYSPPGRGVRGWSTPALRLRARVHQILEECRSPFVVPRITALMCRRKSDRKQAFWAPRFTEVTHKFLTPIFEYDRHRKLMQSLVELRAVAALTSEIATSL